MESNHSIPPSPPLSQPERSTMGDPGPEGAMTSPLLTLIHQLLRDKDRLLKEKDEMLRSKSASWQDSDEILKRHDDVVDKLRGNLEELRQSVQVRDEEIESQRSTIRGLQEKYSSAKAKNRRLAKAFNEYMDRYGTDDENDDDDNKNDNSVMSCKGQAKDEDSDDEIDLQDEELDTQHKQLQELFPIGIRPRSNADAEPARKKQRLSSVEPQAPGDVPALLAGASLKLQALQEQSIEVHDDAKSEDAIPATPSTLKRKQKALVSAQVGDPMEDRHNMTGLAWSPSLRPDLAQAPAQQDILRETQRCSRTIGPLSATMTKLVDDFLTPWHFNLRPYIHEITTNRFTHGDLHSLPEEVLRSIYATFGRLKVKHEGSKKRLHPVSRTTRSCCFIWARSGSNVSWTIDNPRQFACRLCLNAQRACFVWQEHGRWDILPLPPAARSPSATPTDTGYYIYRGKASLGTFFPLYRTTHEQDRRAKIQLGEQAKGD